MDNNTTKTVFKRFFEEPLSKAVQDPRPVFEVGIPMRDDVELAADVYLPIESERPAPVILQSTPYDKSNPLFFPQEARFFQEHGYAVVIHDVRGRGKSEGEWRAFVNDGRDTHDAIEWAAAQEWSNGRVGTTGVSYMGWTQWAAAAERPPHLKCMVSISAAGRWQQEIPYNNGVFNLYFGWWVYLVRRRISEFHGLEVLDWDEILRLLPLEKLGQFIDPRGRTWDDMMEHETLDDFWKSIRFDDRYDQIETPCLHVTGWYDMEDLPGAFHHYEHMMAHSPARDKQQLIVGPWGHIKSLWPHSSYAGVEFGPQAALDTYQIHLRWFDYWLKGIDNGVLDDPPVRLFEPGRNVWRKAEKWPLGDEDRYLYLRHDGGEGRLADEPPQGEDPSQSYRYDPDDPAPTQLDVKKYPAEDIPLDQGAVESRPDVIVYTSEEMTEELVISGWAHLEIFAASDGDETEWHVKLTDVHPDGRSLKVCQGCLRASCRDSLEDPTPLQPGEVYRFDVELWPTHHVFLPGHRIRVSITSADFPWYARCVNRFGKMATLADPRIATNTIHHSKAYLSRIKLPVAPH